MKKMLIIALIVSFLGLSYITVKTTYINSVIQNQEERQEKERNELKEELKMVKNKRYDEAYAKFCETITCEENLSKVLLENEKGYYGCECQEIINFKSKE